MDKKRISLLLVFFFIFSVFPMKNVKVFADTESVPSGLSVTAYNQYSGPTTALSWTAVTGATGYNVYKSDDGGSNFNLLTTVTTTNYKDTAIELEKTYLYKVSAVVSAVESDKTEAISAKVYTPLYKFDVGGKNLETGYTLIGNEYNSPTTIYDDSVGYGFTSKVGGRDRGGEGVNSVYRDYAFVDGKTYKVKLPIGKYSMNFICGSSNTDSSGTTTVKIYGQQVLSISHSKNKVLESNIVVSVKDSNPLEITFGGGSQAKFNGLIVTPLMYGPKELIVAGKDVTSDKPSVTLTWTASADTDSYNIYRKEPSADTYTKIGNTKELIYKDETARYGKLYSYYVASVGVNGEGYSPQIEVSVIDSSVTKPQTPSGLVINRTFTTAAVTWPKQEGVLFYNIYRKSSLETNYTIMDSKDAGTSATLSYTDENLAQNLNYKYHITAVNKGGESDAAEVEAVTGIPAIPGSISIEKIGWSVIDLVSVANEQATNCYVYRSESLDGEYTKIGTATKANNVYRYQDTGLTSNKEYFYKFSAFNDAAESGKTAAIRVTTKSPIAKPTVPTDLVITSITKSGTTFSTRLDWKFVYGATSYNVYRADNLEGNYSKIGSSTNGLYTDSIANGVENTVYYYKVTAVNGSGESELSEAISSKLTSSFRTVPAGLNVGSVSYEPAYVSLNWTPVTGASAYNVYRTLASSISYVKVGISSSQDFTDTTAFVGNEYLYKVTAVDENGESKKSTELGVKFYDGNVIPLQAPEALTFSYQSDDSIRLNWKAVDGATRYNIYKSSYKDTKYICIGSADAAEFTYSNNIKSDDSYYTVTALNIGGESIKSTPVQVLAKTTIKRHMEKIDRGLNAVVTSNGVLVSWRLLGIDNESIAFNVYRNGVKINTAPITSSTNYLDASGTKNSTYYVAAVLNDAEVEKTESVTPWETNYKDVPIKQPLQGVTPAGEVYYYTANDATIGDLDGDGKYEIVLNWQPRNAKDNSQGGYTGNTYIDAYELDGTFMWRIDLGKNIRSGAHYTDVMVYDLDGDGKAEVALRTADGSIDGQGNIIGDENADYRRSDGFIVDGPEFHTIFEGATGKALATETYEPQRGSTRDWSPDKEDSGNRADRFLAGIAYLDGKTPSVIFQRGYYTRLTIGAYNWDGKNITKVWSFDSNSDEVDPNGVAYKKYEGQGNHQMSVGDVDGDGMDEIITGASVIDNDGKALYTTGLGHGDAMHLGDLDPDRPGLELYQVHEDDKAAYGYEIHDAATGEILSGDYTGKDTGRGLAADIDPRYKGEEFWAIQGESWDSTVGGIYTVKGEKIGVNIPSTNFAIWWDGDLSRELLDHKYVNNDGPNTGKIDKWDYVNNKLETILFAEGTSSSNSTKGNPALQADILGDWREEAIWRLGDNSALRIYTTPYVTENRIFTLMHDPIYRLGVAWQNTGYNQPPHTSFYLGTGMETPKMPDITMLSTGEEVLNASSAPIADNIIVKNNESGTDDIIIVKGLNIGDKVKVYDSITGGNILGSATVTTETAISTTRAAIVVVPQLGQVAGKVYVSVTNQGRAESIRIEKAYDAEENYGKDFTVKSTFNMTNLQPNLLLDVKTSVTNNKSSIQSVIAIVALFDGNDRMVNVSYISKNVPVGSTENLNSGFKLPADITNHKVRVFVWDGTSITNTTMQPLSNVVIKN